MFFLTFAQPAEAVNETNSFDPTFARLDSQAVFIHQPFF